MTFVDGLPECRSAAAAKRRLIHRHRSSSHHLASTSKTKSSLVAAETFEGRTAWQSLAEPESPARHGSWATGRLPATIRLPLSSLFAAASIKGRWRPSKHRICHGEALWCFGRPGREDAREAELAGRARSQCLVLRYTWMDDISVASGQ